MSIFQSNSILIFITSLSRRSSQISLVLQLFILKHSNIYDWYSINMIQVLIVFKFMIKYYAGETLIIFSNTFADILCSSKNTYSDENLQMKIIVLRSVTNWLVIWLIECWLMIGFNYIRIRFIMSDTGHYFTHCTTNRAHCSNRTKKQLKIVNEAAVTVESIHCFFLLLAFIILNKIHFDVMSCK